jgi:hypothetical protein
MRYGNIQRLDLILEAENDSANRYKVSKQADVLMLFLSLLSRGAQRARDVYRAFSEAALHEEQGRRKRLLERATLRARSGLAAELVLAADASGHCLQRPLRWTAGQAQTLRLPWKQDDLRAPSRSRRQTHDLFAAVCGCRRENVTIRHRHTEYLSTLAIAIPPRLADLDVLRIAGEV